MSAFLWMLPFTSGSTHSIVPASISSKSTVSATFMSSSLSTGTGHLSATITYDYYE